MIFSVVWFTKVKIPRGNLWIRMYHW